MITENELLNAIAELKAAPVSYQNCQKLATFCTLYDYLYARDREESERHADDDAILRVEGESEFLQAVNGKKVSKVFAVINELMDALEAVQPRMYDGVLRRLEN